jgi:transposase
MPHLATRHNKPLKAKYEALKARGKPAKLALTAIMRTLIEMANSLIKNDRCWSPFAT